MKNILICFLVSGLLLSPLSLLQAQAPDYQNIFQKGILQEEGEGNLTNAIEIYNSLVNDTNAKRSLRAKALLHVGICYEKLGNQNARKAYQKLISEYSDQSEIVAMGKEHLKGLKKINPPKKNGGIIATQIKYGGDRISPDEQSLIYVDWSKPAIKIRDIQSGKTRIVSKVGNWNTSSNFPDIPIWSPDGKQFAYYWLDTNNEGCEFHIANVDGTNDKVIAKGKDALYPFAWSSDGKYIVGSSKERIVLFSVIENKYKSLKSNDLHRIYSMEFSPDNKYIVYAMRQIKGAKERDIYMLSLDGKVDKKIISNAAHDFQPRWSTYGKHLIFVSDRLGKNDLWKIGIENGQTIGVPKLIKSNLGSLGDGTSIMGITKNQSVYYANSSSRRDVYLLNMDLTGKNTIHTTKRISDLKAKYNRIPAISKDGRYIAFTQFQLAKDPDITGHMFIISIYDTKTEEIKILNSKIFILAQLYWYYPKLQWSPNGDKLLFQARIKDHGNIIAGVFSYDVNTEEFETLLEMKDYKDFHEIPSTGTGHTFSNDGKNIYYLSTDRKNILKTKIESKKESVFYTSTIPLAEFKISKDDSRIAYTYYHGDDGGREIYIEPIMNGNPTKIISFNGDDQTVNLIAWDSDDNYIYYVEKESWITNSIMRISAAGGNPEHITNLKDTFPEGEIGEVIIDSENGIMAIDLRVSNGEVWKLEGVFDE